MAVPRITRPQLVKIFGRDEDAIRNFEELFRRVAQPQHAGAHDTAKDYAVNQIVTDSGTDYIALSDVARGTLISDTDYWRALA